MDMTHEGPGHADVTLGLVTDLPDGGKLHRSWTICECSALLARLSELLGLPACQTIATRENVAATVRAVQGIPGAVHVHLLEGVG
jgi:hypothetical protein